MAFGRELGEVATAAPVASAGDDWGAFLVAAAAQCPERAAIVVPAEP